MQGLQIISFNFNTLSADQIGTLYIEPDQRKVFLQKLKTTLKLDELIYLATCNRVEFICSTAQKIELNVLLSAFSIDPNEINTFTTAAQKYENLKAVEYLFRVACSLESMVLGEREIITQIKQAYANSIEYGTSGDFLRILIKKTIETAKAVYTQTAISRHAVSVMSVAYEKLKSHIKLDASTRFVFVGAGQTIHAFSRLIRKKGITKAVVFNRSLKNAEKIAGLFKHGTAHSLSNLKEFDQEFDVLVSCTASDELQVDIQWLSKFNTTEKFAIDFAIPFDIDREIETLNHYRLIDLESVKKESKLNIEKRKEAIASCQNIIQKAVQEFESLYKERQVELAMRAIPEKVKQLKSNALNQVFAKDIETLDDQSKEVLEKVLMYLEKKYISEPMKMAKEIILQTQL